MIMKELSVDNADVINPIDVDIDDEGVLAQCTLELLWPRMPKDRQGTDRDHARDLHGFSGGA